VTCTPSAADVQTILNANCCFSGRQMPLNKPPLSTGDIALIASWINAGAP
jgi:hypothetical protein